MEEEVLIPMDNLDNEAVQISDHEKNREDQITFGEYTKVGPGCCIGGLCGFGPNILYCNLGGLLLAGGLFPLVFKSVIILPLLIPGSIMTVTGGIGIIVSYIKVRQGVKKFNQSTEVFENIDQSLINFQSEELKEKFKLRYNSLEQLYYFKNIQDIAYLVKEIENFPFCVADQFDLNEEQREFRISRLYSLLLIAKRTSYARLPKDVLLIILKYCPELIPNKKVFTQILPCWMQENSDVSIDNISYNHLLMHFPIKWHTYFCNNSNLYPQKICRLNYAKIISIKLKNNRILCMQNSNKKFWSEHLDELKWLEVKVSGYLFDYFFESIIK